MIGPEGIEQFCADLGVDPTDVSRKFFVIQY